MHAKLLKSMLLCAAVAVAAPAEGRDLRAVARTLKAACTAPRARYAETTNYITQSAALDNAAWADINTPTVTADTWDFGGGLGETISDNYTGSEGRAFVLTTSTADTYTVSCYMKTGTTNKARLEVLFVGGATGSLVCNITTAAEGERASCTATATGAVTSVSARVQVGFVAGDIGTILVGGCQFERGAMTPYIATSGSVGVRAAGCY